MDIVQRVGTDSSMVEADTREEGEAATETARSNRGLTTRCNHRRVTAEEQRGLQRGVGEERDTTQVPRACSERMETAKQGCSSRGQTDAVRECELIKDRSARSA